jgi:prepilin-type N-terminal cleavage/methylation domain-containing protein
MKRFGLRGTLGRPGFTMIEMLTVIAIIAILAGILFPVFATVRRNVRKATCTKNLHDFSVALKLYKDDHNGVYPEALYGFQDAATGQEVLYLYPQYVKAKELFRCPLAPYNLTDNRTVAGQHPTNEQFTKHPKRLYNAWNSYDGQFEPINGTNYIVKYVRHWSRQNPGFGDNPRQLLYKNPPEDTVVTWCTYHRDYNNQTGEPQTGSIDLVLHLGGNVKPTPSNKMYPPNNVTAGQSYLVGATE